MRIRPLLALLAGLALLPSTVCTMAEESAITPYGERSAQAPDALQVFSFLVGKWQGGGRTREADGSYVQWEGATWIGRYVLNGMAIADEVHGPGPDGKTYLGITLRQFDAQRRTWTIEFINVSRSFLRRQVNPHSGSVSVEGRDVVVISRDGARTIRERYGVMGHDHFTYSLQMSQDGGRSWEPAMVEMTLTRIE